LWIDAPRRERLSLLCRNGSATSSTVRRFCKTHGAYAVRVRLWSPQGE
jgi:hypothetical protein